MGEKVDRENDYPGKEAKADGFTPIVPPSRLIGAGVKESPVRQRTGEKPGHGERYESKKPIHRRSRWNSGKMQRKTYEEK